MQEGSEANGLRQKRPARASYRSAPFSPTFARRVLCGVRELAPAVCRAGLPARAPRINLGAPISRLAFAFAVVGAQHRGPQRAAFACWGGSMLCPATMLGYLLAIRLAQTGAPLQRRALRAFCVPSLSAGKTVSGLCRCLFGFERSAGFFSPASFFAPSYRWPRRRLRGGCLSRLLRLDAFCREGTCCRCLWCSGGSELPVHPSCLLALSAANVPCLP